MQKKKYLYSKEDIKVFKRPLKSLRIICHCKVLKKTKIRNPFYGLYPNQPNKSYHPFCHFPFLGTKEKSKDSFLLICLFFFICLGDFYFFYSEVVFWCLACRLEKW